MTTTTANNEDNNTSYQDVLNKYAQAVDNNPAADIVKENIDEPVIPPSPAPLDTGYDSQITPNVNNETQPEAVIPPAPVSSELPLLPQENSTVTNELPTSPVLPEPESPLPPQENPVTPVQLPPHPVLENNDLPPQEPPTTSITASSGKSNIFKFLFFISLLIFLGVTGTIAFSLLKPTSLDNFFTTSPTPIVTETPIASVVCELNDKKYEVGESFTAADGCNTCTCFQDSSITCTENTCEASSSTKAL